MTRCRSPRGLSVLLLLLVPVLAASCNSTGASEDAIVDQHDAAIVEADLELRARACCCGTAEHDVLGCTAACCAGERCVNPACTCVQAPRSK